MPMCEKSFYPLFRMFSEMYTDVCTCQAIGTDLTRASISPLVLRMMKQKLIPVVSLFLKLFNPALKMYKGS